MQASPSDASRLERFSMFWQFVFLLLWRWNKVSGHLCCRCCILTSSTGDAFVCAAATQTCSHDAIVSKPNKNSCPSSRDRQTNLRLAVRSGRCRRWQWRPVGKPTASPHVAESVVTSWRIPVCFVVAEME